MGDVAAEGPVTQRWRRRDRERGLEHVAAAAGPDPQLPPALTAHSGASSPRSSPPCTGTDASVGAASGSQAKQRPTEPCCICLESFDSPESEGLPRICRKCGNSFHQHCLSEWARTEQQLKWEQKPWLLPAQLESGSCPCCRSSKGHDKARRWAKK